MIKRKNTLIIVSLMFALLSVNFLFGEGMGLIVTLLQFTVLIGSFIIYKQANKWNIKRGLPLLIALVLLSFTYVFRDQKLLHLLNIIVFYGLVIVYNIHMLKDKPFVIDGDLIIDALEQMIMPIGEFPVPYKHIGRHFRFKKVKDLQPKTKQILLGVGLAIPILVVFMALMSSADDIFKEAIQFDLSWLIDLLDDLILPKLIVGLICFSYLFGYFHFLIFKDKKEKPQIESKEKVNGDIAITTILTLVNSLFTFFVFIQFKYLFSEKIIQGMTFSSYARKGFFELTVISLLVIVFTLILAYFTQHKINKGLMTLMILNTMVIAYSAIYRLNLYITAYGYTWLRIVSLSFVILQIIIMIALVIHLWHKVNINLIIASMYLIAYLTLNFTNMDALIINGNMNRYLNGHDLDMDYYTTMSTDSIDALMDYKNQFQGQDQHKQVLMQIDSIIEEHHNNLQELEWFNYNYSYMKAYNKLKK